jgi:hypothetical protein
MKRFLLGLALLFPLYAHATVRTLQVTVGAANTPILNAGAHLQCRWFVIQDNAAASIRIGDASISTTRGILLAPSASGAPGGSFFVGPDPSGSARDLGGWFINGTAGNVIDIVYDDGQ